MGKNMDTISLPTFQDSRFRVGNDGKRVYTGFRVQGLEFRGLGV